MYINLMKALIVAGGWDTTSALDSTEVFSGGAWMTVGPLPVAVSGSRGFTFGSSFYMTGVCLVFHCSATQSWIVRRLGGFCHKIPRWGMEVWCWHPILERYWAQVAQANLLPHCWHCWILSRWIILVSWGRPSDLWHSFLFQFRLRLRVHDIMFVCVWRWLWWPDHQQWRWWLLERRICLSILSIDMMFAPGRCTIYFSNTLFIFNECLLSAPYCLYCNVLMYSLVIFYLVYLKLFHWNKIALFQNFSKIV